VTDLREVVRQIVADYFYPKQYEALVDRIITALDDVEFGDPCVECLAKRDEARAQLAAALEDRERLRKAVQRADQYKGFIVEGGITGPDPDTQPTSYVVPAVAWDDVMAALEEKP